MSTLEDRVRRLHEQAQDTGRIESDEPTTLSPMQPCCECGEPVRAGNFYREVSGWERPRDQGGANQVTLRRETGRVMCRTCVDLAKLRGQTTLL